MTGENPLVCFVGVSTATTSTTTTATTSLGTSVTITLGSAPLAMLRNLF